MDTHDLDISRWSIQRLARYLATAADKGTIIYAKTLVSFLNADCERDLFAHAALAISGRSFEVLAEKAPDGYANIDICMSRQLWEIKSPNGDTLRGVETAVRKAQRQFKKTAASSYCPRLIFNARYHTLDDSALLTELRKRLEQHGFANALFISKRGRVISIPLNKNPTFLLAGPPGC